MIKTFKHKGLEKFFTRGIASGIQSGHVKKLRNQLYLLEAAESANDLNMPGYDLHRLKGKKCDIWSIKVNGNWRLTFEFIDGNVYILNYEDYH